MSEDDTTPRTLWTETLLDILGDAIARQKEEEILRALREIRTVGMSKGAVLRYVDKRFSPTQAKQLDHFIKTRKNDLRQSG